MKKQDAKIIGAAVVQEARAHLAWIGECLSEGDLVGAKQVEEWLFACYLLSARLGDEDAQSEVIAMQTEAEAAIERAGAVGL